MSGNRRLRTPLKRRPPTLPSRRYTLGVAAFVIGVVTGCEQPQAPAPPQPAPVTKSADAASAADQNIAAVEPDRDRQVVVTIDDLPLAMADDYTSDEARLETVRMLVDKLNARAIPFVGFFNGPTKDPWGQALTDVWLQAEHMTVGNHTWSHHSARRTDLEVYLADLQRGHEAVRGLKPQQKQIPFRFPYLSQGFEPQKRAAIFERLELLSSRHAPVTIDTSDWLYARGYLEATQAGDVDAAARYKQSWLWNIDESTVVAEHLADDLFGREPPQILLLHANRLNAEHLDEALDLLADRGYRFVSLADAISDPAYKEPDNSVSPTGDSHWRRLRRSRSIEIEAVEPEEPQ